MNYLISFFRSKLDLSNIGLQRGEKESGYFCTPVGAKVIGWAGVDGIHFCIVKGFGELIFAVNPTYDPGHYVHPRRTGTPRSQFRTSLPASGRN